MTAMGFFSDHIGLRGDIRYLRSFDDLEEDNEFDLGVGNLRLLARGCRPDVSLVIAIVLSQHKADRQSALLVPANISAEARPVLASAHRRSDRSAQSMLRGLSVPPAWKP